MNSIVSFCSENSPHEFTFMWWGCCGLCLWHKPAELSHSFVFCSCVCLCFYGPFNCISFHIFSQHLSAFLLCSSGLISALLVLSTIYLYMTVSFRPDIILCGWLGFKHQLTNSLIILRRRVDTVGQTQPHRFTCRQLKAEGNTGKDKSVLNRQYRGETQVIKITSLSRCLYHTSVVIWRGLRKFKLNVLGRQRLEKLGIPGRRWSFCVPLLMEVVRPFSGDEQPMWPFYISLPLCSSC